MFERFIPNLDKPTDHSIRFEINSGIYIEFPPFSYKNVVHLLAVRPKHGLIRTSLVINP